MRRHIASVAVGTLALAGLTFPSAPVSAAAATDRQSDYAAAARAHGVPESVLLAVSYLESRWDTNGGTPSTSGGFGPMHLTRPGPAIPTAPRTRGATTRGRPCIRRRRPTSRPRPHCRRSTRRRR